MRRVSVVGNSGSGKSTLAAAFGVPHLATGDMLRRHVAQGTRLGRAAEGYMERGELVPDRLVIDLILLRLSGRKRPPGFVLDGFPRTLVQAEKSHHWGRAKGTTFHAVVSLDVPEEELVRRLLVRGRDSGRSDDNEDTIRNRLKVYGESTRPLLDFYRERGILLEIDGTGAVEEVTGRILSALEPINLSA